MPNIFYIADLHFGHANVIQFDNRPFSSVEEMEEILIMNWNSVVRPGDTCNIIGDFVWGKKDEWLRIVRRLNGNKVLVRGNHDLKNYPPDLRREFADIKDFKEIKDNGRHVLMSHYPQLFYKHSNDPNYYMVCGHVHRTAENDYLQRWIKELKAASFGGSQTAHVANCGQIYNVGAMMPYINYIPRTLDHIINWKPD